MGCTLPLKVIERLYLTHPQYRVNPGLLSRRRGCTPYSTISMADIWRLSGGHCRTRLSWSPILHIPPSWRAFTPAPIRNQIRTQYDPVQWARDHPHRRHEGIVCQNDISDEQLNEETYREDPGSVGREERMTQAEADAAAARIQYSNSLIPPGLWVVEAATENLA